MVWEVWWALVLGFASSAIVQAWVPRRRLEEALGGRGEREVALASGLGAASSSCSYAAVGPGSLLLAQILGAGAGLISLRRQRPARIVFNLARLSLTTSVAITVFRLLPGLAHPFAPAGWGAALAACLAATVLGLLIGTVAIAVSEGTLVLAPGAAAVSILSTAAITDLSLVAIQLARAEASSTVLLALPALIGGLSLVVLGERARRTSTLSSCTRR